MKFFLAINEVSGEDRENLPAVIAEEMREAGHEVEIFQIPRVGDLKTACVPLVKRAVAANGLVIAAGGDGTVNGLAALCYEYKVPLGIIPLGTFNYFARGLGIPTDRQKAIELFGKGRLRKVSTGFVNGNLFLNNASFGLYPIIIRKREEATAKYGRKRIIGALSALDSLFHKQRIFSVIIGAKVPIKRHASMVFVGNNSLQLENFGLKVEDCTKQNKLTILVLQPLTHWATARLLWRSITKNLPFESSVEQFCADTFDVELKKEKIDMVIDGEIIQCDTPITFQVDAQGIDVWVPLTEQDKA